MRPLVMSTHVAPPTEELIQAWISATKLPREEAIARMEAEQGEYWVNDIYQVQVTYTHSENGERAMAHINIRRRDGKPVLRDWRHFQQIKNQIAGEECEAIELYPAESRLVDTSNKYHLWAVLDPTFRFPIGWSKRDVSDFGSKQPGLRQRPFEEVKQ